MLLIFSVLKRKLIFVHRWLGVIFCLPFSCWFLSGIVLMYCDYPSVSEADRINHESPLDPSRVHLSPGQAYARLAKDRSPNSARLVTFDGRPAYRFRTGRTESVVYADDGEEQDGISRELARRVASAWVARPNGVASAEVIEKAEPDAI